MVFAGRRNRDNDVNCEIALNRLLFCAFQQRPSYCKFTAELILKLKNYENYRALGRTIFDDGYTRKDRSNEYKIFFQREDQFGSVFSSVDGPWCDRGKLPEK